MIDSAIGVVLRSQRHSETSLIVRWLTQDAGRVSTLAKGARRPKSAFAGKLDLFAQAEFTFNRSARSDLHTLREVSVNEFHLPLREDVGRLQVVAYCTALLEQTTEIETPLPGLFELFSDLLGETAAGGARPRLIFGFELKLLDALGLFPSLARTGLKPSTRELVTVLAQGDWKTLRGLQPSPGSVNELNAFLHGFLIHHLGKIPKTRGSALQGAGRKKP